MITFTAALLDHEGETYLRTGEGVWYLFLGNEYVAEFGEEAELERLYEVEVARGANS